MKPQVQEAHRTSNGKNTKKSTSMNTIVKLQRIKQMHDERKHITYRGIRISVTPDNYSENMQPIREQSKTFEEQEQPQQQKSTNV